MKNNRHKLVLRLVLLLVILIPPSGGSAFNDQVMGLVLERLEGFMNVPVDACQRLANFRSYGGFENGMEAADRDKALKRINAEIRTTAYFGLEDGTFLFYLTRRDSGDYREPGESGYNGTNVPEEKEKYWNSCVNRETGEMEQCVMEEGAPYIQCKDDCELAKCPDQTSQKDCSIFSRGDKRMACEAQIQWCSQYTIEQVQSGEKRGYIPRTSHCIDSIGQFVQERGKVLLDASTGELGDCLFGDGKTLVQRSLVGQYAYCGGNGKICDNTFLGGFRSSDYDPRYRSWYKEARLEQKPLWTEPYPFFTDSQVGITYSHPIYSIEDNKKLFSGVIAVDYLLVELSDFLQNQFKGTNIQVAIAEDTEPHYLVAVSTGSKPAGTVLTADPSKPCPDDSSHGLCKAVRFTFNDIKENPNDAIIRRAFTEHAARGFPNGDFVTSKVSDDVGSAAYISQGRVYEQENANLRWRVIVTMPVAVSDEDSVLRGNHVFAIVCLLGGLGAFLCFYLFLIFYSKRTEPAVVHADWRFTCAFLVACSALNTSTFTLLGPNTDGMCMLRMWSFNALFACALSPLFIKVFRMYKLFSASAGFRRVSMTHFQAFWRTIPIALAELMLLALFSFLDPPKTREALEVNGAAALQHLYCDQESRAFFWTQVMFDGLLVLCGCVLAYLTRNLDRKFGEAKQLGVAMYNIAFTGIVIIAILQLVDMTQSGKIILQAIGILWGTVFSGTAFVLPRLIESVNKPEAPKSGHVYGSVGVIAQSRTGATRSTTRTPSDENSRQQPLGSSDKSVCKPAMMPSIREEDDTNADVASRTIITPEDDLQESGIPASVADDSVVKPACVETCSAEESQSKIEQSGPSRNLYFY